MFEKIVFYIVYFITMFTIGSWAHFFTFHV
jgi:hypothetical protein